MKCYDGEKKKKGKKKENMTYFDDVIYYLFPFPSQEIDYVIVL